MWTSLTPSLKDDPAPSDPPSQDDPLVELGELLAEHVEGQQTYTTYHINKLIVAMAKLIWIDAERSRSESSRVHSNLTRVDRHSKS